MKFLFAILATFLLAGCASPAPRPPNILLIITDDLGYGEVGCYGQKVIRTPNIDALAARGVRFTDAYSGSPVCAPSRCCLLTGKHTGHAAIRDNKELQPEGQLPLPPTEITIATLLKQHGYATGAIGKWGLGPPGSSGDPFSHGFDRFFGYNCQRHAHNHCPPWLYDDHAKIDLPGNKPLGQYTTGVVEGQIYAPDLMREQAEQFIRSHTSVPFFLLFATPVPHASLQVPDESLAEYRGKFDDPPYDGKKGYLAHPTPRAAYAAMVTRMDRDVGRILDLLRELELERNTLVIFTSDNGPTFNGGTDSAFFDSTAGLRGLKGQVYEGGIRVPLIISMPGTVREGAECESPCANWDLFPTLGEIAGVDAATWPSGLDGVSLVPALRGTGEITNHNLYWEYPSGGFSQAARMGQFKGVRTDLRKKPDAPLEVYDLILDPQEHTNIATERPIVAQRLRAIMDARTPSPVLEWNVQR